MFSPCVSLLSNMLIKYEMMLYSPELTFHSSGRCVSIVSWSNSWVHEYFFNSSKPCLLYFSDSFLFKLSASLFSIWFSFSYLISIYVNWYFLMYIYQRIVIKVVDSRTGLSMQNFSASSYYSFSTNIATASSYLFFLISKMIFSSNIHESLI